MSSSGSDSDLPSYFYSNDDSNRNNSSPERVDPDYRCDDYIYCRGPCDAVGIRRCPGLGNRTPLSRDLTIHGSNGLVDTCSTCRQHTNPWRTLDRLDAPAAISESPWGHQSQLCHDCIRDEVALYWQRQGTAIPNRPGAAPSLARLLATHRIYSSVQAVLLTRSSTIVMHAVSEPLKITPMTSS